MNGKALGLLILPLAGAVALYACSAPNPPPPCNVAHGDYAAKYILESGSGACARLAAEAIGVDRYYKQDGGPSIVVFQPSSSTRATSEDGGALDQDWPSTTTGTLKSELPEGDRCFVTDIAPLQGVGAPVRIAFLDDGGLEFPGIPLDAGVRFTDEDGHEFLETKSATPFRYELSDVEMYNIPMAPSAQQFKATLEYSEGACKATYRVVALYPAVHCYAHDPITFEPVHNDDGSYVLDPSLCEPFEDYDAGRIYGSGIFHEFETVCDPVSALCVLKADDIGPGTHKAK